MNDLLAVLAAYAIGSVVWGVVLGRAFFGSDPRQRDNPGASGAFRTFGAAAGLAVGVLDVGKGLLAVRVARWFGVSDLGLGLAVVGVVAGHNWPAWFGWRGGGGLATAAGALTYIGAAQTLPSIAVALGAAAVYKLPVLYGRLPMSALPFGALWGLPLAVVLFCRAGNQAGIVAATGCLLIIGVRGLQMLAESKRRAKQAG